MKKILLGLVVVGILIVGGCLAVVGIAANDVSNEMDKDAKTSANGGVTSSTDDEAISHVKIAACKADQFGAITAKLVIKNRGDDQASYTVGAEAVRGKNRVAELNGVANNVRPGQTVRTNAIGMLEGKGGDFTCKLVSVDRF